MLLSWANVLGAEADMEFTDFAPVYYFVLITAAVYPPCILLLVIKHALYVLKDLLKGFYTILKQSFRWVELTGSSCLESHT